jgi:hypothetical protein
MTASPWHITRAACARYAHLREWDGENIEQATRELGSLLVRARFVERDRHGRELWRSPRADGRLRWVIDPRKVHQQDLPQVIWVGQSRPPARLWAPADREKETGE